MKLLEKQKNLSTDLIGAQVGVFTYYVQGQLFLKQKKLEEAREAYTTAFKLYKKSKYNPYEPNISTQILSEKNLENIEYIGRSDEIKDHKFKQAFLLASISLACQNLNLTQKVCQGTQELIAESLKLLEKQKNLYTDPIGAQVGVFTYYVQGQLFLKQKKLEKARKAYTKAFDLLEKSKYNPYKSNISTIILSEQDVNNIYWELIKSSDLDINSSNEIAISFREHLYDGLEFSLKKDRLQEADRQTLITMLYIAGRMETKIVHSRISTKLFL